jgi:hypothetical protein
VAALCLTASCSLVTSFEGFDRPVSSKPDAETGVADASDGGKEAVDPCHVRWPAEPPDGSIKDIGELVAAMSSMRTHSTGGPLFGFDLDDLCTCPARVACLGAQAGQPCDPPGSGIDNAAAALFTLFSKSTGASMDESGLRLGLDRGRFSVVFRLSGWNGEADDPDVLLQVLAAFNGRPGKPNADGGVTFDGDDVWTIDEESLASGNIPTAPIRKAYVRGGVLVAEASSMILKARIPTVNERWLLLRVFVRDFHLTARITRQGGELKLTEGRIGGRAPTADLFKLATYLGACPGTVPYEAMKPVVCDARDLPTDPGKDGRDIACETISLGVAFEALPARVASATGRPADELPCDGGGTFDCK